MGTTTVSRSTSAAPGASTAPRASLRKRFALVSAGLLSVLVAFLGVNFAGDTGTVSADVAGSAGISVTTAGLTAPDWDVSVGSASSVTDAGDIATINPTAATSTKMMVSVYVTNLDKLAVNYSSWNFKIALFNGAVEVTDTEQVITSDSGTVSWVVPTDVTYTVKVKTGGSLYTIANDTGSGSLSPAFFVRATQL